MKSVTRLCVGVTLLGCLASVLVFAFQAAPQPDGGALYKRRCAMCHGMDGKGFPAIKSPDFTSPDWQAAKKDQDLVEVIKNGKKGTKMPGFADKLKDEEIQAIVAHIRTLNSQKK